MAGFNLSLVGEFHTLLYDEEPLPIEEYLRGIPKSILLKLATFTISLDPNSSKLYGWKELLDMWFRTENNEFKKKIGKRCVELEYKHKAKVSLLSPLASLRLFEIAFSFSGDEDLQDPISSEINLFKAYLVFLTNETNRDTISETYFQELEGEYKVAAIILNQTYPVSDFTNYNLADIFITQTIKAYFLFEFLISKEECKFLIQEFYTSLGLDDWRDYFQSIIPIIEAHSKHPSEGWTQVVVERNEKFEKGCFFLEAISLKTFDSELDSDFKLLRGSPMYKVEDGVYAIISPLFVFEKVYKGMYFKLKEVYDLLPHEKKGVTNFRSYYTTNFTENFLLYKVLDYIYSDTSYIQYSGEELVKMGHSGFVDYYIRNGNNLFLFENKDVFVNASIKQSFDFKVVEEEFKKKFYYEKKREKIIPKAVLQLISNVENVLTNQLPFDTNYKSKNVKIYPILILHDSSFNSPGLNYVVNFWFKGELDKLEDRGLNVSNVKPLTIINIDSLLLYADFLKTKKDSLNNLIDEYVKFGKFDSKRPYRDFEEFKAAYGKSQLSFSFFIDQYTKLGYKLTTTKFRQTILEKIFQK